MAAAAVARLAAAQACRACQTAAAAAGAAGMAPVEATLRRAIVAVEAAAGGACCGRRRRRPRRPRGGARGCGSWEAVAATPSEGSILREVSAEQDRSDGAPPEARVRSVAAPPSPGGGAGAGAPPVAGRTGRGERTPSRSGAGKGSGKPLPPLPPFTALMVRRGAAEAKGAAEGVGAAEAGIEEMANCAEETKTKAKELGGDISEPTLKVDQAADRFAELEDDDRELRQGLAEQDKQQAERNISNRRLDPVGGTLVLPAALQEGVDDQAASQVLEPMKPPAVGDQAGAPRDRGFVDCRDDSTLRAGRGKCDPDYTPAICQSKATGDFLSDDARARGDPKWKEKLELGKGILSCFRAGRFLLT